MNGPFLVTEQTPLTIFDVTDRDGVSKTIKKRGVMLTNGVDHFMAYAYGNEAQGMQDFFSGQAVLASFIVSAHEFYDRTNTKRWDNSIMITSIKPIK